MPATAHSLRLGSRDIPIVLPRMRDPRLHTAAVIISVHVIGITALGFRVSVPQILVAIITAGVIDVTLTYRRTGTLVWPASGMLTGSGVALILRLGGMSAGDYWSWSGWHWYVLVAGVSILTKYLIRIGDRHLFNPSNVGLVAAFLIVGGGTIEPLDFWWSPPVPWMIVAYAVIVGGGVLITKRLHLLETATAFWVVLASGLGVLAASGHCMTAAWSPTPVCGARFWSVLVGSPEVLIFLFFMITDPKTIPEGKTARLVFGATLGVATTLMIAPHTMEYGAKVGLLASLVIWSPLRPLFDRWFPAGSAGRTGAAQLLHRAAAAGPVSLFVRGVGTGIALVVLAVGIVLAGGPARQPALAATAPVDGMQLDVEVEPSTLPAVEVDPSVRRLDVAAENGFAASVAMILAENLAIEAEAMRTADGALLGAAIGGERLDEMQARLDEAVATGERRADEHTFDSLSLSLHEAEGQSSAGLVFLGKGQVDRVTYDAFGEELTRRSEPFASRFVLRRLAGGRWLLVDVEEAAASQP